MRNNNRIDENISEIKQFDPDLDFIPLTNDLLFHMVFTKNQAALRNLMSCLLNIPEAEILDIEILNPMQYNEQFDMNLSILDLKLHLNHEHYILVEMQVRRFRFWPERTLVYSCRQIADQDKGEDFDYGKIQPVVQIAIMDHTLFPEHKRFFASYELKDKEGFLYSDKLRFLVMDLTAISEASEQEKKQGLVEWAEAFKANDWKTVEQNENQGVREAMETMKLIMANPGERQLLEYRRKAEVDRRSMIASARQDGWQEGEKKGRTEGRMEGENRMARLMNRLISQGRIDDITRASNDPKFRDQLYLEFKIE